MSVYHWYDSVPVQLVSASSGGGGTVVENVVTVTANYTAAAGDIVVVDSSGGAITVTLPNPATATSTVIVKAVNGPNLVTVLPHAAETIEGNSSLSITVSQSYKLVPDGTNWWII